MAPLFTQLLKPNTSESSLRRVFFSSFLFTPSASPVFSASLVDPVPGTPLHLDAPTLVHTTLISCLGTSSTCPMAVSLSLPPTPPPIHYAASHPLVPVPFHASHAGCLSAFSWQGFALAVHDSWNELSPRSAHGSLLCHSGLTSNGTSSKRPSLCCAPPPLSFTLSSCFLQSAYSSLRSTESVYVLPKRKSP